MGLLIKPNNEDTGAEGATSSRRKRFKSGSVKKLLLLFVVQAVPETYGNMDKILLELGIENLTIIISADLKVLLFLLRIMIRYLHKTT